MIPVLLTLLVIGAEPAKTPMLAEPEDVTPMKSFVIDVRSAKLFEDGHLPGAINHLVNDWGKAVTEGKADAKFWATELAAVGIAPGRTVIVSGDDMREVCRGWWLLRYAGVEDVRVFNGPVALYKPTGPLGIGPVKLKPVPVAEWKHAPSRQAHKDDVLARATGKEKETVIDGRSTEEYKDSHVPKAKHLEWSELIDGKSGKFKSIPEMKKLFESRGIDPSESPLCYCQSGGRASVVAFAVELVGSKPARNYYRSWSEWGKDDSTPKEK